MLERPMLERSMLERSMLERSMLERTRAAALSARAHPLALIAIGASPAPIEVGAVDIGARCTSAPGRKHGAQRTRPAGPCARAAARARLAPPPRRRTMKRYGHENHEKIRTVDLA